MSRSLTIKALAVYFHRNGYVRYADPERRKKEPVTYRKGSEVRLVANSLAELKVIRRLLRDSGFKTARPFLNYLQWVQPVYGIQEVERFLSLVGESNGDRQ